VRELSHRAVKVLDTPTFICGIGQDIEQCLLRNTGKATVFVGSKHVLAAVAVDKQDANGSLGFPIEPGELLELKSFEFDSCQVWAVAKPNATGVLTYLVQA
jgi:hypothetical protein